ncbi:leucine--tRNA ligase [Candidatus Woesebacteria bacterium CG_4_10_14_0_2_um_filter_39_14]|uniref:Leucine--tRNA ligase n=3 Tax=Microgenomates group TaxID=1794810 RepID=A0A2M6YQN2_9BACT|nr:MAG: leucine--tRNA ligase [Candidatus Shapirobacteria bacterium CG07_land_8_20_14_0_80_39_12]PIZ48563.1 MAG: leucine--tRNA ligase [Candidatus Woesebacteria bacterium CG_4_10_14_0_2_um_filter_39_14]PJA49629.1 MAG: leucine--tRNA ligase [Candidatus Shapirobacteria bacterium CG_4_9_14_3_um_filter_39_13]
MKYYHPSEVEPKWQKKWEKAKLFQAVDFDKKRKKQYLLVEFPYPSGEGLHLGHAFTFSLMDVLARQKRMLGFNVLYPMGWDAFGLPTENYALKTGIHPAEVTKKNTARFREQMKKMALAYDWEREVNTSDPQYYKWTQWIFLQLFKHNLAYKAEVPVGWCPACRIVLANEEIIDGHCERCGAEAERKEQSQWLLRITKYAERLVDDLDLVDYPESVKAAQRNWIGRSEGVAIKFGEIEVFTTRVDTIFGVTAVVIAPEHPLVGEILKRHLRGGRMDSSEVEKIRKYVEQAKKKSELERTELAKEKTGVFTGLYCLNPVNNEKVPIWVGDYVVATYGGGAVMVVPAHDYRDYDFGRRGRLEIRPVVKPQKGSWDFEKEAYVEEGILINSGPFNGLKSQEAIKKITEWLVKKKLGQKTVAYKLRDWVFSRQHYWGEPIPIIHCAKCGMVPVPEKDLPVELPYVQKYKPTTTGESPLANIKNWVEVACPECGGAARRETDTMPNWAGSNWYYLRYLDPKNKKELASRKKIDYWLPVDLYLGGAEHTTLHLLYSRFWHKFLNDIGVAPGKEPYYSRRQHGMILAEDGEKMSKSRGNTINPDEIIKKFGADTLRLYLLFMGPYEQTMPWSARGLEGCWRFLNRVWRLTKENVKKQKTPTDLLIKLHQTIKKVSSDLEEMKFNTAIAAMMEFINDWTSGFLHPQEAELFVKILAPFAPHLAEELWCEVLGQKFSVHQQPWPKYDDKLVKEEMMTIIIQVNGKMRGEIKVPSAKGQEQGEAEKIARQEPNVKKYLEGKKIKKVIFVPGRIINFVI